MGLLEYYLYAPAIIIISGISIIITYRIIHIFFVDDIKPFKVPSIAFISCNIPQMRTKILAMTAISIAISTVTIVELIVCLFVYRGVEIFACMSISVGLTYGLLIMYVHTMKKYEVLSIQVMKEETM